MAKHQVTTPAQSGGGAIIQATHPNSGANLLFLAAGSTNGAVAHNHAADGTYAGLTAAFLTSVQTGPGGEELHLWTLTQADPLPSSGTAKIDLTGDTSGLAGAFSSYTRCSNLKTAGVVGATGSGTHPTISVPCAVGDWIYAVVWQPNLNSTWTPDAGMNERADLTDSGPNNPSIAVIDTIATANPTVVGAIASISGQWGIIAIPFTALYGEGAISPMWWF